MTALARALAQVRLATPTRPPLWAPSPPVDSAAEVVHAPSIRGRYKLSRQVLAILLWEFGRSNLAPRRDRNCRIGCGGSAAFHNCTCSDTRPLWALQARYPPLALPLVMLARARASGSPATPRSALEGTQIRRPSLRPCDGTCSVSAVSVAAPLPGDKMLLKNCYGSFLLPVAHLPSPAPPPISSSEPIDTQAREDASLLPRKNRQHLNFLDSYGGQSATSHNPYCCYCCYSPCKGNGRTLPWAQRV